MWRAHDTIPTSFAYVVPPLIYDRNWKQSI